MLRSSAEEERDGEERHGEEPSEAHGVAEEQLDEPEDDELAAGGDDPQGEHARDLAARARRCAQASEDGALGDEHDLERQLEEERV